MMSKNMEATIFHLALIPPILIILFIVITIIYLMWYRKNYITKESTDKYDKGWHKCWQCKNVESTMYFIETIHGRIYKCSKHITN